MKNENENQNDEVEEMVLLSDLEFSEEMTMQHDLTGDWE
jgi:hypothetical protein